VTYQCDYYPEHERCRAEIAIGNNVLKALGWPCESIKVNVVHDVHTSLLLVSETAPGEKGLTLSRKHNRKGRETHSYSRIQLQSRAANATLPRAPHGVEVAHVIQGRILVLNLSSIPAKA